MVFGRILFAVFWFLYLAVPVSGLELAPHPRLYVSSRGEGKVPDVEQLKSRITRQEYAAVWERVKSSDSPADIALVYLLTGDTTRLNRVREALSEVVDRYEPVVERALAYDWAYGAFTPEERKRFAAGLIQSAEAVAARYRIPSAYHNYCRGRHMAQTMAMLAAWDDEPRAKELLSVVEEELRKLLEILGDGYPEHDMAGRAGYGGGWPEGFDYDRHGSFYALQVLLAWRSAGLGDLISRSNYWRDKIYWLFYGTAPDGSFLLPYEDNDFPMILRHDREMMTVLAGEFHSGHARYWIETFADTLRCRPYWELIFSDPSVGKTSAEGLPTSRLIPGLGLALMRSSWDWDAAFVSFHCGPWYTYHQHAAQGSFTVYRNHPLVIEPGVYDGNVDEHYVNWRIRTISHNCITVLDSSERFLGPREVPEPANDGGQIIHNWTLKPATVAEWRAQRKMRQTGTITTFLTDTSHDFVVGEAAGAYNPDKVRRWCRQLLFIKPHWLVLCDLVVSGKASYPKTLILHTPEQILAEKALARTPPSGKPSLVVYSLLPEGADLKVAGGPGKTFEYGGRNWKSPPAYNGQYEVAWRLEVKAPAQDTTTFLTVLYIPDPAAERSTPPKVELIESSTESVALSIENGKYRVALDPRSERSYRLSGPQIAYSITGSVLNRGLPVESARVYLEGTLQKEVLTDHHGRYIFSGLLPGEYRVKLQGGEKSHQVRISNHSVGELNFD